MPRLRSSPLLLGSSRGLAAAISMAAHGSIAVGLAASVSFFSTSGHTARSAVEISDLPRLESPSEPLRPSDLSSDASPSAEAPPLTPNGESPEELPDEPVLGEPPPELLVEGPRTPRALEVFGGPPGSLRALTPRRDEVPKPPPVTLIPRDVVRADPTPEVPTSTSTPAPAAPRTRIATRIPERCSTAQTEELADRLRWRGLVRVDLDIDVNGLPTLRQIAVVRGKSDLRILDSLTAEMKRWRFHPGKRGEKPVECSLEVLLDF